MSTDAQLLDAWRDGDASGGEALVSKHFVSVYRFFRNKVDGDLDDLVQATFARCMERRDSIEDDRFRAYLFAVARNVLREYYRARTRDREIDLGSASVADLGASPSGILADKQEHRLLLAALRSIPLDEQIALELVYWESMTGRELATALGVPEGTARTRLRAAKLSLEAAMAQLARSPAELKSTLDNLERWSTSVRDSLVANAG